MVESAGATSKLTVNPDDAAAALRMGWSMAEVRGRLDPSDRRTNRPGPPPPALLLADAGERSPMEDQVEAVKVLAALSEGGTTDFKCADLSLGLPWASDPVKSLKASELLRYLAACLLWARSRYDLSGTLGSVTIGSEEIGAAHAADAAVWWDRLRWFLWAWDEAIQDQFATQTFGTASSYELGRGLAESYWALRSDQPGPESTGWSFLLGPNRIAALSLLCRRLTPVIGAATAAGVEASLAAWKEVAADAGAYVRPTDALEAQVNIWRDLLVTARDPLTFVDAKVLARVARRPWQLIKAFGWELLLGVVAAVLLGLSAAYLSSFSKTFLAVVGALGITASALIGWAKTTVQSVTKRVRDEVNQKVIDDAVTNVPEARSPAADQRSLTRLLPERSVTRS